MRLRPGNDGSALCKAPQLVDFASSHAQPLPADLKVSALVLNLKGAQNMLKTPALELNTRFERKG